MIEVMEGLSGNVVGFRAGGQVSSEDYEKVLIPAVEEALKKHEKVRLLYQLGDDFMGFDPMAMWEDAKVGLTHMTSWERIAIVTDVEWLRNMAHMFGFVMPGHVKVYKNAEIAQALEWISS